MNNGIGEPTPAVMHASRTLAEVAHPVPEVRFARSGSVELAYKVLGDGTPDIVVMIGWVSHLEVLALPAFGSEWGSTAVR